MTNRMVAEPDDDLTRLCTDRPDEQMEIFRPNSWYGMAATIRAYCGWPKDRPIPMVLPHGVAPYAEEVWSEERTSPLPAVYSYPPYLDDVYRRHAKRVIPGCSPWLYLSPVSEPAPSRQTILVMPAHSSHHVQAEMDHQLFARAIRDRYGGQDIQCCMYWRDVQLGHHWNYLRLDIPVVSAGHIFDPAFMTRLRDLFSSAKLVVTNDWGSHIYYAAGSGVPVTVDLEIGVDWSAPNEVLERDHGNFALAGADRGKEQIFLSETPEIGQQQALAMEFLGSDRMLAPADLRSLLDELWTTPGFRSLVVMPWRVKRFLGMNWS